MYAFKCVCSSINLLSSFLFLPIELLIIQLCGYFICHAGMPRAMQAFASNKPGNLGKHDTHVGYTASISGALNVIT